MSDSKHLWVLFHFHLFVYFWLIVLACLIPFVHLHRLLWVGDLFPFTYCCCCLSIANSNVNDLYSYLSFVPWFIFGSREYLRCMMFLFTENIDMLRFDILGRDLSARLHLWAFTGRIRPSARLSQPCCPNHPSPSVHPLSLCFRYTLTYLSPISSITSIPLHSILSHLYYFSFAPRSSISFDDLRTCCRRVAPRAGLDRQDVLQPRE